VICKEYPQEWVRGEEAYYPVNTEINQQLLKKYQHVAAQFPNLIFGGRLGHYRYYDMDKAVLAALECFETKIRGC
jgi:UDP-galactopyranose mutase